MALLKLVIVARADQAPFVFEHIYFQVYKRMVTMMAHSVYSMIVTTATMTMSMLMAWMLMMMKMVMMHSVC